MIDLTGYRLTFDDEFNAFAVSPDGQGTRWASLRPDSKTSATTEAGFGASAFVDPSSGINPFSLGNGALTITETNVGYDPASIYGDRSWVSGLIQSKSSFSQLYGYFEMRAKLPADVGAWPSFWMLNENGIHPPEIDVVETYGPDSTGVSSTIHTQENGTYETHQLWSSQSDHSATFKTYGVLWTSDYTAFFVDGQETGRFKTPADQNTPMYLVADLALYPGIAGETSVAKSMQIDYIRAFSADALATTVALDSISSPDKVDTSNLFGAMALSSTAAPASGQQQAPSAVQGSTLVVRVSGDSWNGAPQASVSIDGVKVASNVKVTADHSSHARQDIAIDLPQVTSGPHVVTISYDNDANSGAYYDPSLNRFVNDRNVFVESVTLDGATHGLGDVTANTAASGFGWLDPDAAVMAANGVVTFKIAAGTTEAPSPTPVPSSYAASSPPGATTAPATTTQAGSSTLSLHISGDSWQGAPHASVFLDGVKVGGPFDVSADHASGTWQDISLTVSKLGSGAHTLSVSYDNDANSGAYYDASLHRFVNDRNIFVQSVTVDGAVYDKSAVVSNSAASGFDWLDPAAAVMAGNGTVTFGGIVSATAASDSPPSPTTTASPASTVTASSPASTGASPASAADVKLFLSGDSWNGSPEFAVSVDGVGLGRAFSSGADHSLKQMDVVDLGALSSGDHSVRIAYLNDANSGAYYDAGANKVFNDRNLFVDHFEIQGSAVKALDVVVANTAAIGWDLLDPHAAVMAANGTADFMIHV